RLSCRPRHASAGQILRHCEMSCIRRWCKKEKGITCRSGPAKRMGGIRSKVGTNESALYARYEYLQRRHSGESGSQCQVGCAAAGCLVCLCGNGGRACLWHGQTTECIDIGQAGACVSSGGGGLALG